MPLEGLLMVTFRIENMYFGVVHGNDNISVRQMKTGDHALFWSNVLDGALATFPPCSLDHIFLLEMRSIRLRLWSSLNPGTART
jgi:hypothetical protein